jgi:hypothetical protein
LGEAHVTSTISFVLILRTISLVPIANCKNAQGCLLLA